MINYDLYPLVLKKHASVVSQLFRIMRLTSLFLVLVCIHVSGAIRSQTVTLNVKHQPITKILASIEAQTGYMIVYNDRYVTHDLLVSLQVTDQPLEMVLDQILSPCKLTYQIQGTTIAVIGSRDEPASERGIGNDRSLQAQRKLSGRVTDEEGSPLEGVSVTVEGTSIGTKTDLNGEYMLTVSQVSGIVIFSLLGYQQEAAPFGEHVTVHATLKLQISDLDEVVVVGYGSVKKENLTSSISRIGPEAIRDRPISTLSEALAGQLAGVRAQSTTGIPGEELHVQIRGINTINGDGTPLYVIDGIPSPHMNNLNPNDVASIQVLKDASATAIYGARGSNGVILVETKQGAPGPAVVSFEALTGFQNPEKLIGMMNKDEWVAYHTWYRNEGYLLQGGSMSDPMNSRPVGLQIPAAWNDPNNKGTDWQQAIMRQTAPWQSYQMSVSGQQRDLGSIFISGGYLNQQGVIQETYYDRFNFRLNGILNVGKKTRIGLNLAPTFSRQDDRVSQGKETVIHHALGISPLVQLDEATRDWGYPQGIGTVYANPLERLRQTTALIERNQFSTSAWVEFNPIPAVKVRSQFGYNFENRVYQYFQPGNVGHNNNFTTNGDSYSNDGKRWSIQNTISYDKEVGEHRFNLLLGQSAEGANDFRIEAKATGWPNELIGTLNVATTPVTASTDRHAFRIASFFSRLGYDYQDKYLLNLTVRHDGSSRFGSNNKWGTFPAVSAAWKLSSESFLADVSWLDLLKTRIAWGTSGNDRIGNYDYMSRLVVVRAVWNDAIVGGYAPGNIENPDLKWESTSTMDVGLDVSMLSNRIQLNADYYVNETKQLLFNLPLPRSSGYDAFRTNIGRVQNKGWEVELTTVNTTGKVKWNSSVNLSRNRNKVLDMGEIDEFVVTSWDARFLTKVGGPISQFLLYRSDGILGYEDFEEDRRTAKVPTITGQLPGGVRYIDTDGSGSITADDQVAYGNNLPNLIYGITNRVSWKQWSFSLLLQGQAGGNVMFLGQRQLDAGLRDVNSFNRWVRAWKPDYEAIYGPGENPIPDIPGVDMSWDGVTPYVRGKQFDNNDDRRIYDASFIRIRNISLQYQVTKFAALRVFRAAKVYVSVDNLKTFHNYPGVNPETNSGGNNTTRMGVDYSTYPLAKKFTLGVNLNF